jgi:hypothetical protein
MKRCGRSAFLYGDSGAKEGVQLVYEEMKELELGVWNPDLDLPPGAMTREVVEKELNKAQRVIVLLSEEQPNEDSLLPLVLDITRDLTRQKFEENPFFVPVLLPTLKKVPGYINIQLQNRWVVNLPCQRWFREWNRFFVKTLAVPPAFSAIRILTGMSLSCIDEINNNADMGLYQGVQELLSLSSEEPGPVRRLQMIATQVKNVHQELESYFLALHGMIAGCSESGEKDGTPTVPKDPERPKKIARVVDKLTTELGKEPYGKRVSLPELGSTSITQFCDGIGLLLDRANQAAKAISSFYAQTNRVRDYLELYLDGRGELDNPVTQPDLFLALGGALTNGDEAIIYLGDIVLELTTKFIKALRTLHERAGAGRP